MTDNTMPPDEEYDFYAPPQESGSAGSATEAQRSTHRPDPVRFPPEILEEIRRRAGEDDRSVSSWIRRAVEHELQRPA